MKLSDKAEVISLDDDEDDKKILLKKSLKDYRLPPDPPKKAACAFFLYRIDIYDLIKAENPDLPMVEVTRIIGQMWKNIDPALKERYEQESNLNRMIVKEQRQRYQQEYGRPKSGKNKKVKRALEQIRRHFDQMI